jgi:type VI secretion system secreted protein VgrG
MPYTQENRLLSIDTPLGENVLLLSDFSGEEEISRLFRYELVMLSENDSITAADIVGKKVTWTIQSAEGSARYFNGMVQSFSRSGMTAQGLRQYRAEVVPWLWFLTRTRDCRIFQSKTAVQIAELLFQDLGWTDFESKVMGTHATLEYCVQYRESDYDFIARLLEREGIFYFFRHEQGKHTLVLGDQKSAYVDCEEKDVAYSPHTGLTGSVTRWDHSFRFCSGKWAQTDYNFETPTTALLTTASTVIDLPDASKYEIFDYPGGYDKTSDGTPLTDARMEEEEASYETVHGDSTCPTFMLGGKFTLTKHDVSAEEGIAYAITAIQHRGSDASYGSGGGGASSYSNSFVCIPATVMFRPRRITPQPIVHGPQTALVVGPDSDEIHVDKYGRVKVQFFWDRLGKKNENSSCWVRVAEHWAGKNWGTSFCPRIGQEVIVDFLEGNPDRPIITGRVYNAEQMPPFTLPANKTQSGLKTRSSAKGTASDCNELRFEDKKDSEEIYFHAQKDFVREVENDDKLTVTHDQTIEIKNDRTETIKEGNESVTLSKGKRTVTIQGNDSLELKEGDQTITITQGKRTASISGDDSLEVKQGNRTVTLDMGNGTLTVKQGNYKTDISLGKIETTAMQSIELKVGQNSIKVDQSGITLSGLVVKINGQTQTQVSGLTVQVSGSAMTSVGGGITKLG